MTIKDLAKLAGVSHSTVSRSLNNSPLISKETKERIKKLAREYHFDLNSSARSLSTRRTGTIGIICSEVYDAQRNSLYIAQLLDLIRINLDAAAYDSIITFPENKSTGESNIRRLITQKKVDGLLLIIPNLAEEDRELIERYSLPHIFLHFKHGHFDGPAEYIYTDHFRGGYLAGEHLIRSGRDRIITMTEDLSKTEYFDRTEGFLAALNDNGIEPAEDHILYGEVSFDYGFKSIVDNESVLSGIDGIFAQADIVALGAIEALRELGYRVPEDIGVIGYDDILLGGLFRPRLTTVHQPKEQQANLGVKRLLEIIGDDESPAGTPLRKIVEPVLVVRDSCSRESRSGGKGNI
ncbi:MAG: LacI family DNA-binding transcriptional regulator [Spirochaetota bacterium]